MRQTGFISDIGLSKCLFTPYLKGQDYRLSEWRAGDAYRNRMSFVFKYAIRQTEWPVT